MGLLYKKISCGCVIAAGTYGEVAGGIGWIYKELNECLICKNKESVDDEYFEECEKYTIDELIANHGWNRNYPSSK